MSETPKNMKSAEAKFLIDKKMNIMLAARFSSDPSAVLREIKEQKEESGELYGPVSMIDDLNYFVTYFIHSGITPNHELVRMYTSHYLSGNTDLLDRTEFTLFKMVGFSKEEVLKYIGEAEDPEDQEELFDIAQTKNRLDFVYGNEK